MNGLYIFLIGIFSLIVFSPLIYYGFTNIIGFFNLLICNDILTDNFTYSEDNEYIERRNAHLALRIMGNSNNSLTRKVLINNKQDQVFNFLSQTSCLLTPGELSNILIYFLESNKKSSNNIEKFISDSDDFQKMPDVILRLAQKSQHTDMCIDKKKLFIAMAKWKNSHHYIFNKFVDLYREDKDIQKLLSLI